jgi:hypothetical protein
LRSSRQELLQYAAPLPEALSHPARGAPRLIDILHPYVRELFNTNSFFRQCVGSLSAKDSPNESQHADDVIAAQLLLESIEKQGNGHLLEGVPLGRIMTAIKRVLRRFNQSRTQRLALARIKKHEALTSMDLQTSWK